MNKCPQCLSVLHDQVKVCPKCGFATVDDVTKSLVLDETDATKFLSENSMSPEKWQKIKSLFEAAEGLSPDDCKKLLDKSCGDDKELREEVERLLDSTKEADSSFLEEPAVKEAVSMFEEKYTVSANETTGKVELDIFVAGTVLDRRYRIIGLLGKGGMGEVFKAEDIKLEQTVALKFLPDKLAKNEDALKRFIGEVKTARQVAHANVCKVFDIGDIDGKHYISMEFIDGDDLSQLLRRIGRLPSDKAAEISRQICFGLHAIHEAGILHRDLKPANIIIDSNGKARITDFGIAGFEADVQGAESRVGTPAYMSPEQITGKEVTARSDIYSLGLLLYEIFTGKPAVQADSLEELLEKHKTTTPTNPSTLVENIDPIVEKTINRCLEKDPSDRPNSALQVALALPGGNPLEAAIAAGETPSPEMVAAAPKKGALKPKVALALLAAFIVTAFGLMALNYRFKVDAYTPFEKSPEILAEKSREIIKKMGYTDPPTDSHYQFDSDSSFQTYYGLAENKHNLPPIKKMLAKGQPYFIYFLYRQSPEYLEPLDSVNVSEHEPPVTATNMANIKLDVRGRLIEFVAVPPRDDLHTGDNEVDWSVIFAEAGLDFGKFNETKSNRIPPVFADKRRAWQGNMADFPEIPIRIETAEFNGKPVYFQILAPWNLPTAESADTNNLGETDSPNLAGRFGIILLICLFGLAFIVSSVFAYRNLKAGRGDLRGGLKLILFLFLTALIGQFIKADHVPTTSGELSIIYEAISYAGITAVVVGLLYIALEPFVRRSWSEMLISWNRFLAGDFRDPMIGRDILGGGLFGLLQMAGVMAGFNFIEIFVIDNELVSGFLDLETINNLGGLISAYLDNIVTNTALSLVILFIALFFYRLTGRKFLGILSVGLVYFILNSLIVVFSVHWGLIVVAFIHSICLMIALYRYGLLGMISFWFFWGVIGFFPITFDTGSFYFPQSILTIFVLLGISTYCYYISIAGQPILGGKILKELGD